MNYRVSRVLGYIFYVFGAILILSAVARFMEIISSLIIFFRSFGGNTDAEVFGNATGHLFYWTLHFGMIYIFIKYANIWSKKRAKGAKTPLSTREYHSKRLSRLLTTPSLEDIQKAYYLTYTEATKKNLEDVLRYIDNRNYYKLSRIGDRVPYVEDELGIMPATINRYEVYLLVDKQRQNYVAVIYDQVVDGKNEELITIRKTNQFWRLFFCHKRLIYPV